MFTHKESTGRTKVKVSKFVIAVLALLGFHLAPTGGPATAQAQVRDMMAQRIDDDTRLLAEVKECEPAKAILQNLKADVTANNIVITSKDARDQSARSEQAVTGALSRAADAAGKFAQQQGKCPEAQAMALDLKNLFDQLSEVIIAARQATERCGEGDSVYKEPCRLLQPLLDEDAGQEVHEPVTPPPPPRPPTVVPPPPTNIIIRPGFSVKLRGPFVGLAVGSRRAREGVEHLQRRRHDQKDGHATRGSGCPAELLLEVLPQRPIRTVRIAVSRRLE
jgi:hypothetical protein